MSDHDDLRFDDDDLDADETALAAMLTTSLLGQAGTVVLADEPFDPARPTTLDLAADEERWPAGASVPAATDVADVTDPASGIATSDDRDALEPLPVIQLDRRRPWSTWIAGVAAAAVLVAAIVMINAVRQPSVDTTDEAPLVTPDAAWAPTWVPDGLELWNVDTEIGDPRSILAGAAGSELPVTILQLLESSDGAVKVLVSVTPGGAPSTRGTPLTIRGVAGSSSPEHAMGQGSPSGVALEWTEAGAALGAFVLGADEATAVALLDQLVLVDPADPSKGFAEPSDGSLTVRTDDPRLRADAEVVVAVFQYDRGRPTGSRPPLQVVTMAGGSASSGYPGYLPTAFLGSMGDDGVARAFVAGSSERPAEAYTVWPDGRSVYSSGIGLDEASAARIAEGIEPVSLAELDRRANDLGAKLGEGAVVASADLPSGKVEVVGDDQPSAVCLTVGGQRRCTAAASLGGSDPSLMGSVIIDGTWYVFAAGEGPVELGVGSTSATMTVSGTAVALPVDPDDVPGHDPSGAGPTTTDAIEVEVTTEAVDAPTSTGPERTTTLPSTGSESHVGVTPGTGPVDRSVPFESATSGSWTLALLVVPADVDAAWATFPGQSSTFPRPSR